MAPDHASGEAITLDLEAASREDAVATATRMCDTLLANPVTEDYTLEVTG